MGRKKSIDEFVDGNSRFFVNLGDGMMTKESKSEKFPFQDCVKTQSLPPIASPVFGQPAPQPNLDEFHALVQVGKLKEAKKLIRENHWPLHHTIRAGLWKELCRTHSVDKSEDNSLYWDTVDQLAGDPLSPLAALHLRHPEPIELVHCMNDKAFPGRREDRLGLPQFVDHQHLLRYNLDDEGVRLAERVVGIVGYNYPAITHAPAIHPICSLLMHYMPEDDVYNCLSTLICSKQLRFISQTKLMHEATWRIAMLLTKKHAKAAYGHLSKLLKNADEMECVFENWLWWIFKHLPFTHLVRVFDCFLVEGSKVLYRINIAIIHCFYKNSQKSESHWHREAQEKGLNATISKFCSEIPVSPEKLLKSAFSIRNLSHSEIAQLQLRAEMLLKSRSHVNLQPSLTRSWSSDGMPTSQAQLGVERQSHTLHVKELLSLWSWIPARVTMYQPQLLYTSEEHGCSLLTFYSRVEHYEPTLLVVKTTTNEVFGAYLSASWAQRNTKDESGERQVYFGTGETFVFTLIPQRQRFAWVGLSNPSGVSHKEELFMAASNSMMTVGGGGDGQAIYMDENLRFGHTGSCDTFKNPPLCSESNFEIRVVEVYGFLGDD